VKTAEEEAQEKARAKELEKEVRKAKLRTDISRIEGAQEENETKKHQLFVQLKEVSPSEI
jgi:hypothetical protein